jgi:hypothetical protein
MTSAVPERDEPAAVAFNLTHVPRLEGLANEFSLTLQSLVQPPAGSPGPLRFVLIENFMINVEWLMSACPEMFTATEGGVVVYGDSPDPKAALLPKTYSYTRPETLPYGTHHTKMVIAFFDAAVKGRGDVGGGACVCARVCVHEHGPLCALGGRVRGDPFFKS